MVQDRDVVPPAPNDDSSKSAADKLSNLVQALLGDSPPVRVQFWDGSSIGSADAKNAVLINSPRVFRHLVWAPGELGFARAFVLGDLDFEGDSIDTIFALSKVKIDAPSLLKKSPAILSALRDVGVVDRRPEVPEIEYRPTRFNLHTRGRDAAAISHHYDVSNNFYEMVLGTSMTYSCARFVEPEMNITEAQAAKHDHICRKLGLQDLEAPRLLDVGCGWGSMSIHAAATYGARVVGITISREQAERARERVEAAGVSDLVEIRLQDYRDLSGEQFDAISSVGMSEHVGKKNIVTYFSSLRGVLRDQGRLLNHAISTKGGVKLPTGSFMYRYVFPDGELIDVGDTIHAMQDAGFEVRDVESLREHYATTLRCWVANLQDNWEAAVDEVGLQRARVWQLYMSASAVGFTDAGLNLHQVLGVVNDADGYAGLPPIRPELFG